MKKNKSIIIYLAVILLISLTITLGQIKIVSAEEELYCCKQTKQGGICQGVSSTNWQENCDVQNLIEYKCSNSDDCKTGVCLDTKRGICAPGSKWKCLADNGIWKDLINCEEIEGYEKGCCFFQGKGQTFTTEENCKYLYKQKGINLDEFDFRDLPQEECGYFSNTIEGACVINNGLERICKFTTEAECHGKGNFNSGVLCSNPALETNCEKQVSVGCIDGKNEIYWKDSCGNSENIYDSDKNKSWNNGKVLKKSESCNPNSGNMGSQTCGNCDRAKSSVCKAKKSGETHVSDGDFICQDLRCHYTDQWGEEVVKENGESWCVYDSRIGRYQFNTGPNNWNGLENKFAPKELIRDVATDTVGSEHWKMFCVEGEIDYEASNMRDKICQETITLNNRQNRSKAELVTNNGIECIQYNEDDHDTMISKCIKNKQCMLTNIELNKFRNGYWWGIFHTSADACVPRYPPGLNAEENYNEAIDYCSFATRACAFNNNNDDCRNGVFELQVNDLCVSLGDCGTYLNYVGEKTKNNKVKILNNNAGWSRINWSKEYSEYENPVKGQTYPQNDSLFITGSVSKGNLKKEKNKGGAFGVLGPVRLEVKCLPWTAPKGGSNCGICNEDPLRPCTKYRCESLGQTCEIINENTDKPLCVNMEYENIAPIINPGIILTHGNKFQNIKDMGVEVKKDDGNCIQELNELSFTLNTDEYAQCKWSYSRPLSPDYELMEGDFPEEGTLFTLNHTFKIVMPNLESINPNDVVIVDLQNRYGNFKMYVKCQDKQSPPNFNFNEYIVDLCTHSGPDNEPALIQKFSPKNGSYILYNETEKNINFWLDKPAECKYDLTQNKQYNDMTYTASCETSKDPNSREFYGYPCETNLTGLINGENKFYFKCRNQPWLGEDNSRIINSEDNMYTLSGSVSELKVDSVTLIYKSEENIQIISSEGTIISGVENISAELEIKTSGGANNGVAICNWEKEDGSEAPFFETNSNSHKQTLDYTKGTHKFYFKCEDDAGNKAEANATYYIEIDTTPPIVTRAYKEGGNLKIITDELAKCYYTFERCNFEITNETKDMTIALSKEHETELINEKNYYIKCKDAFKNKNSECAIVIKT